MRLFIQNENRVKCGKCGTEFDVNRNDGCPLCGFGKDGKADRPEKIARSVISSANYLAIPVNKKTEEGTIFTSKETESVGSWCMFNSFFPGKAILRILANLENEENSKSIRLDKLLEIAAESITARGLTKWRGFPKDIESDSSIGRLVYHFMKTFCNMGFIKAENTEGVSENVWEEHWTNIYLSITKEGLEFAKLHNRIFDDDEESQVLSAEEKDWLVKYLKKIDTQGYKEYTLLKRVFEFLKEGHNGKNELWDWFASDKTFIDYVKDWSRKSGNEEEFKLQIQNLAPTLAAGKIALLRELGIIRNKRNDYNIVGDLE